MKELKSDLIRSFFFFVGIVKPKVSTEIAQVCANTQTEGLLALHQSWFKQNYASE